MLLLLFILDTCSVCCDTWEGLHLSVCSMLVTVRFSSTLTQTLLGRVIQQIVVLSQVIAFFLALLLLHGSLRSRQLYLDPVQRQNLEHLPLPLQRLYGFDGYYMILVFLVMLPHLFFAIILEPYRLPMIQWSMNLQSILVWMLHLRDLTVIRKQLIFSMYRQNCNWQTFSPKHKLGSSIGFTYSNSMLQILRFRLEFEGGC